jgi:hypothetical protein
VIAPDQSCGVPDYAVVEVAEIARNFTRQITKDAATTVINPKKSGRTYKSLALKVQQERSGELVI